MRAFCFCFTYVFLYTLAAQADFRAGLNAYDRGDFAGAYREWLPVAQRGDANAQFNIGLLYANGKGVARDARQAVEWYRKAAIQGVPAAEYNLGVMYANGDGVKRDVHEAVKWLQQAADHGISLGRDQLADLYGGTVIQNYDRSLAIHKQEAASGDPTAQFDLALMYDLGRGVPRDYAQAMNWYRKAADQSYAPAMTNIGILYYNQEGVPRDLVQAYAWFVRAKLAHDPRADELLQMTMDKMKGDQVRKGEALAADWHPQKRNAPNGPDMAVLDAKLFKQPGARAINQTRSEPGVGVAPRGDASREVSSSAPIAGVTRVVAIGDVNDSVQRLSRTLASASVLDGSNNWIAGNTHLVVSTGRVDGPLADLLTRLQAQAERSGGAVHVLVGPSALLKINDTLYAYDGWYRSEADLDALLREHQARRVVIGHADAATDIAPRFHGKLIVNADAGRLGCLVVEYGHAYALYRGQGLALPADDGQDLERYRRQVSMAAAR